ncbi:metallophosphoesterase [Vagococcus xieshaowenii]|uniref:Phosphoesterase n=1 Tax=Vagococcus xieshaowenii TaxID=2562451 RepID=A0AAJ5EGD4_9ENTE|nr:metallophosphoesterase [Vagococcus xieshaowenii]QCA28403.1 metallophosphoesterase [Vagococcus xieshaowenii]TFZ42841.1 metallophosphoesterase [Vagococcus xieshaowenii]
MKYLVVSDNHGERDILVELADKYRQQVDIMFHCGDSELLPTDSLWQDFIVVTGNCDYDHRYKKFQEVSVGEDTIYMTHGHLSAVRLDLQSLFYEAKEKQANIALYGHTHVLHSEMVEDMLIVNPGSISQPRYPYRVKTYAIINSTPEQYSVDYYNEKHQLMKELSTVFSRK